MTSSCDGLDGYSFGLVNVQEIDKNEISNNIINISNNSNTEINCETTQYSEMYGGEDQIALSPDNGVFSLYHNPSTKPEITAAPNLSTPADNGFTEGKFITDTEPPDPEIRMRRSVEFSNRINTRFNLDISRVVRLLELEEIGNIFGSSVAVSLEQPDISYVAFQTNNTIINRGTPIIRESGLTSIKIRSMLNTGIDSVAIIPFRIGREIELGQNFGVDLFDLAPHNQLHKLPQAVLLRANCKYHCQIGISRNRATPFLGAVDFRSGNLTLIAFNLPANAWEYNYLSNAFCEVGVDVVEDLDSGAGIDFVSTRNNKFFLRDSEAARQNSERIKSQVGDSDKLQFDELESLYSGEVVRAYNRGVSDADVMPTFRYCEFDVFSAANSLKKSESLTHQQYTLHISADNKTLSFIVKEVLGVSYEQTYEKIIR
jgi:predicted nucleic-acid-binding Zn-ribbon protein